MTKQEVITQYNLLPHPEGGYYREVYRSPEDVSLSRGERSAMTLIYYLLGSSDFSSWHRILSDEAWIHIQGDLDLRIHMINQQGDYNCLTLGKCADDAEPIMTVPARHWFAADAVRSSSKTKIENAYALVSCVVAPGFHWEDFVMGDRAALIDAFPKHKEIITTLTRETSAKGGA